MSPNSNAYTLGNDIAEIVKPKSQPGRKLATTPLSIDPEWNQKIDDHTDARNEKVKKRFIESPFLLASFYQFLGLLPGEILNIETNVRKGDARKALEEIDDLAEKVIDWRLKLSHMLKTDF